MKKINITPVCEQTVLPDTFSPSRLISNADPPTEVRRYTQAAGCYE